MNGLLLLNQFWWNWYQPCMQHCFHGNTDPHNLPPSGVTAVCCTPPYSLSQFLFGFHYFHYKYRWTLVYLWKSFFLCISTLNVGCSRIKIFRGWEVLINFFFLFCRIYQYVNLLTINYKWLTHPTLKPGTTLFICHKLSFVYLVNLMNDIYEIIAHSKFWMMQ